MRSILLIITLISLHVNCLSQQYPFVNYTPNDGLVNSRVRSIKQDSKGRMYFITYSGLSVYDGARFINYRVSDGLANDLVNDIYEAGRDSILIATNTQTLNILVNDKIGVFKTRDNFCPVINRFLKSTDGNLYLATDQGLYLLTGKKFVHLPLVTNNEQQPEQFIDQVIEWKNFLLLIPWKPQNGKCLFLYNKITRQVSDVLYGSSLVSAVKDLNGNIFIATPEEIKLIDTVSLLKGKIAFVALPQTFNGLSHLKAAGLFFDAENNLWVFTDDAVTKINPQGTRQAIINSKNSKAGNLVSLFEDREGIIWMASDGKGALKMEQQNLQLIDEVNNKPLKTSFIDRQADTVWMINDADNSICRMTKNSTRSYRFGFPAHGRGTIYSVGKKIYITDHNNIIAINNNSDPREFLHPKMITASNASTSFGLGVVDQYNSIIQLENRNDSAYYLTVVRNDSILMRQPISGMSDQLALDTSGRLWAVTRNNHVMLFSLHPENPHQYLQLINDYSGGLPFTYPRSLAIDSNNNLWIGTRSNGLYEIKPGNFHFPVLEHFTEKNGLSDNFVLTLSTDRNNNVWVGTQSGLDKIFLNKGKYIVSNVSKRNNFFQSITRIASTPDLTTWAVTNEGSVFKILYTKPRILSPPPVLINLAKINGKDTTCDLFHFSYKENNLMFYVSAPSFTDEKSIRYSYLLKGSENNNWSEFSSGNRLNFVNLPPGKYNLQVRAAFPGEIYPVQENSISFAISFPWWQTWWFRIPAAAAAIFLLFSMIRTYYSRQLIQERSVLEKKQAVEKERTRIATDMHDDLGAGLSRIKFLSETIGLKKQQEQPIDEDINKIRGYAHEMIDKMGEIVWALNEKNDTLSDLLSYTRSYSVEYLVQNGIECIVNMPQTLPSRFVSGEFRRNIYLTVKEALHNVVKHAQATRAIIKIEASTQLHISIADNGIGFDKNNTRPFSNGLPNMKKRIQEIGGGINFINGNGTTVDIVVPLT